MSVEERFTLAQVSTWEVSDLQDLGKGDSLILTLQDIADTMRTWVWLLGAIEPDATFNAACCEVRNDGEVFAMMYRPVTEVLSWWRALDWSEFSRDDDCGPDSLPEVWAWAVIDKLRGLAGSMPVNLGRQLPMVEAVRRYGASQ